MSESTEFIWLYVPCGSAEEAIGLADSLVKEELVACGNIINGVQSVYKWQGQVCHDPETLLVMKSRKGNYTRIEKRISELHSYDCPCIVALPVTAVNEPYAAWLRENTASS